jgi:hypothetical protein
MMLNKKQELIILFNEAVKARCKYVYVAVRVKGTPKDEIIINPIENAMIKLNYYANAYDDYLKLKANPDIEITNFGWCDDLNILEGL